MQRASIVAAATVALLVACSGAVAFRFPHPVAEGETLPTASKPPLPKAFSWRVKGAVGPVPNQGQCGGGTVAWTLNGNIEGVNAVTNGKFTALSAGQQIECFTEDICCGGTPHRTQPSPSGWKKSPARRRPRPTATTLRKSSARNSRRSATRSATSSRR